jgi:ABC-type lipopolysaccharide export system ATPase subunit
MSAEHMTPGETTLPRRSKCAAESLQQELARLRQMSVEERIRSALEMDRRFSWIKPAHVESGR